MYIPRKKLLTLSFHASDYPTSNGTSTPAPGSGTSTPIHQSLPSTLSARLFEDNILTGFQIATNQGPLCTEPVEGIDCFLESIQISIPDERDSALWKLAVLLGRYHPFHDEGSAEELGYRFND
jgi:translation elongation factor EF-G